MNAMTDIDTKQVRELLTEICNEAEDNGNAPSLMAEMRAPIDDALDERDRLKDACRAYAVLDKGSHEARLKLGAEVDRLKADHIADNMAFDVVQAEVELLRAQLEACKTCPTHQQAQEVNKILRKRVP